jgi:LPXTG-site transpeptidase (sortase) family protein
MKKSKPSKALSPKANNRKMPRRVLCAFLALGMAASFAIPMFLRSTTPATEPEEPRYALETADSEINFDTPDIQIHTAEDGIAIVNMATSPGQTSEATPVATTESTPAVPSATTADPAETGQDETAPTHDGFTLPVLMDGGSIGVLSIPGIGLSVRVYESDDAMEDMEKGVSHFKSTSAWEGNVGLSAHNVNMNGSQGYFYSLHTLKKGDLIQYETALGVRKYTVESITEIAETDWSALDRTQENRLTLITCITGKPAFRFCVQAVEVGQ